MRKTRKGNPELIRAIGNGLMALSLLIVLTVFFPIIKEEISYRTTKVYSEKPASTAFSVRIPSIGVNAPVAKNIDPWNRNEYIDALKNGIAHAKNSSLPNESGSIYLFAHSSDVPWRMTRYNTAFFRLSRVNEGDSITVTYEGKDYSYKVQEKKTVWPNEVKYLTYNNRKQLILQTCTPIGTSLKRLLVFATPAE